MIKFTHYWDNQTESIMEYNIVVKDFHEHIKVNKLVVFREVSEIIE